MELGESGMWRGPRLVGGSPADWATGVVPAAHERVSALGAANAMTTSIEDAVALAFAAHHAGTSETRSIARTLSCNSSPCGGK